MIPLNGDIYDGHSLLVGIFFYLLMSLFMGMFFNLQHTHPGLDKSSQVPGHFHCVLHAKRGVQIACKVAYVLNGRPLS